LNQENNSQKLTVGKEYALEFIRTEKITTFERIEKKFEDESLDDIFENSGDWFSNHEHPRIVYWFSKNHLLFEVIEDLVKENKVILEPCEKWRYGHIVGLPIAKKIKSYSIFKWYPVSLRINTATESNSSKLEQEMENKIKSIKDDIELRDKVKYIISNDTKKINDHYDYCSKNNIPYIVASGKKYFHIDLDMYHTPYNLTNDGQKVIEYAIRWELQQNPSHVQKKFEYSVGLSNVLVYPIRKERLDEFCTKLYFLSSSHRDFVDESIKKRYQARTA